MVQSFKSLKDLTAIKKSLPSGNYSNGDIFDFDNGVMVIKRHNLNKYLEKYICKNEDELKDTLWFNYGVFLRIADD